MPAHGPEGMGVKVVTLNPANPGRQLPLIHAQYLFFDGESLAPLALVDGGALTALRTSAVSALATRHLAREDASVLVVFGAGVQARAHVRAMLDVRPIERLFVVTRSSQRGERLVEDARDMGLEASLDDGTALGEADVVCTCTTSAQPVVRGPDLPDGVHINAVGAYRPHTRELDGEAVARARVVVETREAALAEAGDLLMAMEEGSIREDHLRADLRQVVSGERVRETAEDVTLFKSVGIAFEDLAVAKALLDRMSEA